MVLQNQGVALVAKWKTAGSGDGWKFASILFVKKQVNNQQETAIIISVSIFLKNFEFNNILVVLK